MSIDLGQEFENRDKESDNDESTTLNLKGKDLKKSLGKGIALSRLFDASKRAFFLEVLPNCYPNIWKACALAGVHKQTVLKRMEIDPEFAQACADIADQAMDQVEGYMATFAATPKGFLDRIAILKANRPEKWNPTSRVEISHRREDPGQIEARRAVLTRIVSEDADVIESVTGKHVASLPSRPEDVPIDVDALGAMVKQSEPEAITLTPEPKPEEKPIATPTENPDSSNARARIGEDVSLDSGTERGYTQPMKLDPFALADKKISPPKKTNRHTTTAHKALPPPTQKTKGGPLQ